MKTLKVYGDNSAQRSIIAAQTKKRAADIVGLTVNEFNRHWCETGDPKEIDLALSQPEVIFKSSSFSGDDYKPVMPK